MKTSSRDALFTGVIACYWSLNDKAEAKAGSRGGSTGVDCSTARSSDY